MASVEVVCDSERVVKSSLVEEEEKRAEGESKKKTMDPKS